MWQKLCDVCRESVYEITVISTPQGTIIRCPDCGETMDRTTFDWGYTVAAVCPKCRRGVGYTPLEHKEQVAKWRAESMADNALEK